MKIFPILFFLVCSASAQIVAWGDSYTAGTFNPEWVSHFESLSGLEVINRGVNAQGSTAIKNRFIAEPELHDAFTVIWAGRNNWAQTATVEADIATMVSTLGHNRFLVVGILNGDRPPNEYSGGSTWASINTLNSHLAVTYGNAFIDIRPILVNAYNPFLPQDVIDYGNDIPPNSLRFDDLHLNAAGNQIVAQSIYNGYLAAIPEPSTNALIGGAAAGALVFLRRRRNTTWVRFI